MELEDYGTPSNQPSNEMFSSFNNRGSESFGMNHNSMNPFTQQQNYSMFPSFQNNFNNNSMNHNSMFDFRQTSSYPSNQSFGQQQTSSLFSGMNTGSNLFTQNTFSTNNVNNQNMMMGLNHQVKEAPQNEEEGEDPEFRPDDVVESESDENDHQEQEDFEQDEGI